jgi:hypothetical protein
MMQEKQPLLQLKNKKFGHKRHDPVLAIHGGAGIMDKSK